MEPGHRKSVLLLNPPGDRNYLRGGYCSSIAKGRYYWPPVDHIILSGLLDRNVFDTHILDGITGNRLMSDVLNYIEDNHIEIVISQVVSASKDTDLKLLSEIKKLFPKIQVLANGEYALNKPEQVLNKYPFLDAVIHDYTSRDIPAYLLKTRQRRFDSISYRENSTLVLATGKQDKHFVLSGIPQHNLLRTKLYNLPWVKRLPLTVTLTSFGCPFKCTFCITRNLVYKTRDVDEVIKELLFIQELGIKEVYFLDPLFTMNKTRVITLCEKMAAKQIDITWSCQSRVNTYDEDMLRAMKNAGCHTMQLGLESGSDEILKNIKKGFSVSDIKSAVELARKYEIDIDGFFILGFPGETKEQAEATVNLAKQLDCSLVSFQLLMPLTGTGFEKESITRDDITYDDRDNVVALNENFTSDELQNIQKKAYKTFYFRFDFIVKKLFEIRTVKDFLQMARQALDLFTVHNKTTRYISQHEAFRNTIRRYQAKSFKAYLQILLKQFDYDYWLWNVLYLLPTQGKLYDLGCGIGFISMLYKAINGARVSVTGIDVNEKRIHTARIIANGYDDINFKMDDIVKCHFDGANAVLLADVLRYLPVEQQNTILRQVYEMLSAGGTLIIKEISYKNDHLLKTCLHGVFEKVLHPTCSICYREAKDMYNFLRKTGYSEVKIINKAPHYIVTCER